MGILVSFLGFLAGVALRSFCSVPVSVSLLLLVVSIAGIVLIGRFKKRGEHELDAIFHAGFLFLFFFSVGLIRYDLSELKKDNPVLESTVGKSSVIEGTVSDDPYAAGANVSFTLRADTVGDTPARGLVKISNADFIPLQYGDKVKVSGLLEKPKNFVGDNGKEFDYVSYLAKDGIYYVLNQITETSTIPADNAIAKNLEKLRCLTPK